jgi:predicted AAA+ superfamily ATPase
MDSESIIRLESFTLVFAMLALSEVLAPRRKRSVSKARRWFANLSIVALNPLSVALIFPILPDFLESYIQVYLQEEITQEGLIRNIGSFTRFLESASFSQGSILNVSTVARDCAVPRKTVEGYFDILNDLRIGYRVPLFQKRARRKTQAHPKFYFFDAGLFRALRPLGPLEDDGGTTGPALEALVLQELLALTSYLRKRYQIHYWRSTSNMEVDFILYGEKTFFAVEVTKASRVRENDTAGLKAFLNEYPKATAFLLYGGADHYYEDKIHFTPVTDFFRDAIELFFRQS